MSDVMLLGATSLGLGLYVLYLLAERKAYFRMLQLTLLGVHEGFIEIEKVNGMYTVKVKHPSKSST